MNDNGELKVPTAVYAELARFAARIGVTPEHLAKLAALEICHVAASDKMPQVRDQWTTETGPRSHLIRRDHGHAYTGPTAQLHNTSDHIAYLRAQARRWRLKAEEIQTAADGFSSLEPVQTLARLANSYISLAEHAEEQADRLSGLTASSSERNGGAQ